MSRSELSGCRNEENRIMGIAIEELESFLTQVKHERAKVALQRAVSAIRSELDALPAPLPVATTPKPSAEKDTTKKQLYFQSIPSFSWDQNDTYVTLYFLDGLQGIDQLPREQVECTYQKDSVELRILGLNGRNYRWIQMLSHDILPEECKLLIRKDRITMKLKKAHARESWYQLQPEEKKFDNMKDTEDDPTGGLMKLMKNMYDTGDDNMKRAIAEAMTKAQSGQSPDLDSM